MAVSYLDIRVQFDQLRNEVDSRHICDAHKTPCGFAECLHHGVPVACIPLSVDFDPLLDVACFGVEC